MCRPCWLKRHFEKDRQHGRRRARRQLFLRTPPFCVSECVRACVRVRVRGYACVRNAYIHGRRRGVCIMLLCTLQRRLRARAAQNRQARFRETRIRDRNGRVGSEHPAAVACVARILDTLERPPAADPWATAAAVLYRLAATAATLRPATRRRGVSPVYIYTTSTTIRRRRRRHNVRVYVRYVARRAVSVNRSITGRVCRRKNLLRTYVYIFIWKYRKYIVTRSLNHSVINTPRSGRK